MDRADFHAGTSESCILKMMPELPEVETIARGLQRRVAGEQIESVWIGSRPQVLKSPAAKIARTIEGKRIERVSRAGKHIVFDLAANETAQWVVHLGMTGRVMVCDPS